MHRVLLRTGGNLKKGEGGFSLVEVMCAVLILGVALVGLVQGVTAALSTSKESEIQTAAALLAAGQIEMLRADGFLFEGVTEGEGTGGLALYRWRQTVTPTELDGLFDVRVEVENSKSGRSIYELRTLLFDALAISDEAGTSSDPDRQKKRLENLGL